jgi:hypothetical protein
MNNDLTTDAGFALVAGYINQGETDKAYSMLRELVMYASAKSSTLADLICARGFTNSGWHWKFQKVMK